MNQKTPSSRCFLRSFKISLAKNGIFGLFCDTEFYHCFCWNLDGGSGGWVAALASGALFAHHFTQTWQGHFSVGLGFLVDQIDQQSPEISHILFGHVCFLGDRGNELAFGKWFTHNVKLNNELISSRRLLPFGKLGNLPSVHNPNVFNTPSKLVKRIWSFLDTRTTSSPDKLDSAVYLEYTLPDQIEPSPGSRLANILAVESVPRPVLCVPGSFP